MPIAAWRAAGRVPICLRAREPSAFARARADRSARSLVTRRPACGSARNVPADMDRSEIATRKPVGPPSARNGAIAVLGTVRHAHCDSLAARSTQKLTPIAAAMARPTADIPTLVPTSSGSHGLHRENLCGWCAADDAARRPSVAVGQLRRRRLVRRRPCPDPQAAAPRPPRGGSGCTACRGCRRRGLRALDVVNLRATHGAGRASGPGAHLADQDAHGAPHPQRKAPIPAMNESAVQSSAAASVRGQRTPKRER